MLKDDFIIKIIKKTDKKCCYDAPGFKCNRSHSFLIQENGKFETRLCRKHLIKYLNEIL